MIHYKRITWEEILPMWEEGMPNMSTEPTSAMGMYLHPVTVEPLYDLQHMKGAPTFYGAFDGDKLIGVNSGHMNMDRVYRSRGLYVKENYRGHRIAQKLLMKTIAQARHEKAICCWSFPSKEALSTYRWMQFQLKTCFFNFQYQDNNIRACYIIDHPGMCDHHAKFYSMSSDVGAPMPELN